MSADAQMPDTTVVPDQSEPAKLKRLSGLWVICLALSLEAVLFASMVPLATPLGIAVSGALALLHGGAAVGLWFRSDVARRAAMWLSGAFCCALLVDWLLSPLNVERAFDAIPFCGYLAAGLYLWFRRTQFSQGEERAAPSPAATAVTGLAILLIGAAWTFWLVADQAAQQFPGLEVSHQAVAPSENAFVLLADMVRQHPFSDDEATALGDLSEDIPPTQSPEWRAKAAKLLASEAGVFTLIDRMLERSAFLPPPYATLEERWKKEADLDWMDYARHLPRLLRVRAEMHALSDEPALGIEDAQRIVTLGRLMARGCDSGPAELTALAVLRMGFQTWRDIAQSPNVTPGMLAATDPSLAVGPALKEAYKRAMGYEFGIFKETVQLAKQPGMMEDLTGGNHLFRREVLQKLLKDAVPYMKPHMTANSFGQWLSARLNGLAAWEPCSEDWRARVRSVSDVARRIGWWRTVMNVGGEGMVTGSVPAFCRMEVATFEAIADGRLTQLYLALRCYQLQHGKLPADLNRLAPEYLNTMPLDPFTDKDFGYEPTGDQPRIWSVGADQQTDPASVQTGDDVIVPIAFAARKPHSTTAVEVRRAK